MSSRSGNSDWDEALYIVKRTWQDISFNPPQEDVARVLGLYEMDAAAKKIMSMSADDYRDFLLTNEIGN